MYRSGVRRIVVISTLLSVFLSSLGAPALPGQAAPTSSRLAAPATSHASVHPARRLASIVPRTGTLIQSVFTDKARYTPGSTATISVPMLNTTGSSWSGTLSLTITHLENTTYTASQPVTIAASQAITPTFTWTTPSTDFQGYGIQVAAGTSDSASSALDVSSTWTRFPRYGFMDTFPTTETAAQSQALINQLAQTYHIDAYQMYDWFWRHEQLLQRTNGTINSSWTDWSGRTNSWNTLLNQISAIHAQNGGALSYVMS
jgi:dextranase